MSGTPKDTSPDAKLPERAFGGMADEFAESAKGAGKIFGESALTVAKTAKTLLLPFRALVWGYEQIGAFFEDDVERKLQHVPPERRITPQMTLAGPAIEALRFAGPEKDLRDLFSSLLATAMDSQTAPRAHPAFVDLIRNMTSDEARIIRYLKKRVSVPVVDLRRVFTEKRGYLRLYDNLNLMGHKAGCARPLMHQMYLNNLIRLGIMDIPMGEHLTDAKQYEEIENHPDILKLKEANATSDATIEFSRRLAVVTPMGRNFINACVLDVEVT